MHYHKSAIFSQNLLLIWLYHNVTLLLTSHGIIQHPVLFCKVKLMIFGYFYLRCSVYDTIISNAVYLLFSNRQ